MHLMLSPGPFSASRFLCLAFYFARAFCESSATPKRVFIASRLSLFRFIIFHPNQIHSCHLQFICLFNPENIFRYEFHIEKVSEKNNSIAYLKRSKNTVALPAKKKLLTEANCKSFEKVWEFL